MCATVSVRCNECGLGLHMAAGNAALNVAATAREHVSYARAPNPGPTQEQKNRYLRELQGHFVGAIPYPEIRPLKTELLATGRHVVRQKDPHHYWGLQLFPGVAESRSLTGMEPIRPLNGQCWYQRPECEYYGACFFDKANNCVHQMRIDEEEIQDEPKAPSADPKRARAEAIRSVIIRKAKALQK